MASIFSDGSLQPGRDPNDAWWIVVRGGSDWAAAVLDGAAHDPSRDVVELTPAALADGAAIDEEITGADGTRYRAEPHRVLWRRRCDADWSPLPGIAGPGWSTGHVRSPRGLAIDRRGWIYVADSANHRVQVVAPDEGRVIAVLGHADAWGRPVPGEGGGGMTEPFAVAVGARWIYVADGRRIHVFDAAFRYARTFVPADSDIVAIAADDDALFVAVRGRSRALRFDCAGTLAAEVAFADAPAPLDALAASARFATEGSIVIGPLDGGLEGLSWHEVRVDAEVPAGTSLEIQSYAADGDPSDPSTAPGLPAAVPWAPERPVAIPLAGVDGSGENGRLVLSDVGRWERARRGPYRRATPILARFGGDGPTAAAMQLPWWSARLVRAGDGIQLRSGAVVEAATVASVAARTVTLVTRGAHVRYRVGTTVELLERDNRPVEPGPVTLYTLVAEDEIDLAIAGPEVPTGVARDVAVPHAVGALLAPGDVVRLRHGGDATTVLVDAVDTAPAALTLTAAVVADHRSATARLVDARDRLVVDDPDGPTAFAPGERIDVLYIDTAGGQATWTATVAWSDPTSSTLWTTTDAPAWRSWLTVTPAEPVRGTDRGRFLWVRLRLRGARAHRGDALALATPSVRAVRIVAPRLSYLGYLPAVFGRRDEEDPSGALFLERFLGLFEKRLTSIESRFEDVARELNPFAASDDWLRFLGTWFDLAFDPSWPRERRAALVAEALDLYRQRGTVAGLRRYVEIYTGRSPAILEGFQVRPRSGLVVGCHGVLGCAALGGLDVDAATSEALLDAYAHRFTLVAYVDDDCQREVMGPVIQAIVESSRPAHTLVDVQIVSAEARIGMQSTIGVDLVLGDAQPSLAPLGTSSAPPASRPVPVLGLDAVLGAPRGRDAAAAASLSIDTHTLR
jgi:phage tail-like protein